MSLLIDEPILNFVVKIIVLKVETLRYFSLETTLSYLQSFCHSILAVVSQTTDEQHNIIITLAELCKCVM